MSTARTGTPTVTATVVVCAYTLDRWDVMCEAIAAVEREQPDQIVVVIDHNPDLLELSRARWPHHDVVANSGVQGLSGARNTGVEHARSEVVAFLDDDAVPRVGWLAGLLGPFDDPIVGLTGGRVEPRWVDDPPTWFPDEFLWVIGCSYRGLPTATGPVRNPIGASMAIRATVFDIVGDFVDGVGRIGGHLLGCEETELAIRARRAGYDIVYEPSSVVDHQASPERGTTRYFARRCYAEGLSKAMVSDLAGSSDGLSSERAYVSRVLPSGVASGVWSTIRRTGRPGGLARAAVIVFGLVVTSVGFARGSVTRRLRRLAPAGAR